jgi:hypothetical protein
MVSIAFHTLVATAEDQYSNHILSNRGKTWIILFFAPYYHRATEFPSVGSCFGSRRGCESNDAVQILSSANRRLLNSPTGGSLRISHNQLIKGMMLSSAIAMAQEENMFHSLLDISSTLFQFALTTITVMLLHYAT